MQQSEILAMPAGREMDTAVAVQLFEWTEVFESRHNGRLCGFPPGKSARHDVKEIPHYSTDIAAAWLVWEELRRRLDTVGGYYDRLFDALVTIYNDPGHPQDILDMASMRWFFMEADVPLTLCRLALMMGKEGKE